MATRSPFSTPSSSNAWVALQTSSLSSAYVRSRVSSSGSPTQWNATLSPLPASTCRSTQLTAALRVPPTNHFANGGLDQSRTWSHFWPQSSRSAASAQNASGSASARAYASSWTLASAARSAGGSNRRSSLIRLDRVCSLMSSPVRSYVVLGVRSVPNLPSDGSCGRPPAEPPGRPPVSVLGGHLGPGAGQRPHLELDEGVLVTGLA